MPVDWKYDCVPIYMIKFCYGSCTDKKISSSGIKYIAKVLCKIFHEIMDDAIKLAIKKKKYTVDYYHITSASHRIGFIMTTMPTLGNDAADLLEQEQTNYNKWIHYMDIIKNDVLRTMHNKPNKKIKLTTSAKELMISLYLLHIYKIATLITSCHPFVCEKIVQLRTIHAIYNIWMTLTGISHNRILEFEMF